MGISQRRTAEQDTAFAQLRALAEPHRLRVQADVEGFPIIPGKYGRIERHDRRELAVCTDRPRFFQKLWVIPGVRRHQTGDREMRALFPPEALEQVAGVIRAKRKRGVSSATARRRGYKARLKATSRPQKAPPTDGQGSESCDTIEGSEVPGNVSTLPAGPRNNEATDRVWGDVWGMSVLRSRKTVRQEE